MIEYNIKLIEEDIEKISSSQEDDKNFFNLLELNKKGMNVDVFNMLYNLVISTKGQKKFAHFIKL
jgi:flagellar assembly factor FliW